MINILIQRDKENRIRFFSAEGHAYAADPGEDLVCASVSVLSQTAVLGLTEVAGIDVRCMVEDGFLSFSIPVDEIDEETYNKVEVILDTIMIGIKGIIEEYSEYITLHNEEV